MNWISTIILLAILSTSAMAQQDSVVNRNRVIVDHPDKLVIIPINDTQTAYYRGKMTQTPDILLIKNTQLAQVIGDWYSSIEERVNNGTLNAFQITPHIKPLSSATQKDIDRVIDILKTYNVNKFAIIELSPKDEAIVTQQL